MAALAAKATVVKASVNGTTWYTIAEINDAGPSLSGDNQDVTVFGDSWIDRIQGLKDASWSIGGFYDPTDTNGQVAILSALVNDTAIYVQVFPGGGTAGFQQQVKVASFDVSDAVDGVCEVSIDFDGAGAVTLLP
jgi:predicted secreted protein